MEIHSNGSKWAGEALDTFEDLLQVLAVETLDPSFEEFGRFYYALGGPDGYDDGRPGFRIFGNFWRVSHVFRIDGTAEELAEAVALIRANQQTPAYIEARASIVKAKAEKVAWYERRRAQDLAQQGLPLSLR